MDKIEINRIWQMLYDIFFDIGFALEDSDKYTHYADEPGSATTKLKIIYARDILFKLYSAKNNEIDSAHANQYLSGNLEFSGRHSIKKKHLCVMKELSINAISLMTIEKEYVERVLSDSIKVKNYLLRTKSSNNEIRKENINDNLGENQIQFSRLLNKFVNSIETLIEELNNSKYDWKSVKFPEPNNQNVLHIYAMLTVIAISELCPETIDDSVGELLNKYSDNIRRLVNEYFMNLPGNVTADRVDEEPESDKKNKDRLMNDEDIKLLTLMVHSINKSCGYQMSEVEMRELFNELASITQIIRSANLEVWRQYNSIQKKKSIEEQYNFIKEFEMLENDFDKDFGNNGANMKL